MRLAGHGVNGGSGRQPSSPNSPWLHQALVFPGPLPHSWRLSSLWLPLILNVLFPFQHLPLCPPASSNSSQHLFAKNKNVLQLCRGKKFAKSCRGTSCRLIVGQLSWREFESHWASHSHPHILFLFCSAPPSTNKLLCLLNHCIRSGTSSRLAAPSNSFRFSLYMTYHLPPTGTDGLWAPILISHEEKFH